eukprot:355237-Chlamydomonas_euryale.AAC.9
MPRRLAAYEVEPASYAVALRAFRKIDPNVTAAEAYRLWRSSTTDAVKVRRTVCGGGGKGVPASKSAACLPFSLPMAAVASSRRSTWIIPAYIAFLFDQEYYNKHQLEQPKTILDVGCSVGLSTRWLADTYPAAEVQGIDMSPYFLSIAEYEERCAGCQDMVMCAASRKAGHMSGVLCMVMCAGPSWQNTSLLLANAYTMLAQEASERGGSSPCHIRARKCAGLQFAGE